MRVLTLPEIRNFILGTNFRIECSNCLGISEVRPCLVIYPEYDDIAGEMTVQTNVEAYRISGTDCSCLTEEFKQEARESIRLAFRAFLEKSVQEHSRPIYLAGII